MCNDMINHDICFVNRTNFLGKKNKLLGKEKTFYYK